MFQKAISKGLALAIAGIVLVGIASSCSNYKVPGRDTLPPVVENSCEGCHSDYERLIEVHTPDTNPPVGGCGGSAPFYETYDRVVMRGDDYEAFRLSTHGKLGCTKCHGGNNDTGDKYEAHDDTWTSTPSMYHQENCASCHEDESNGFVTSIHNGTGQKRKVAMRSSAAHTGSADFDKLPQHQIDGYNNKCATCHGTCGNCHVVRPKINGGGLARGHRFSSTENPKGDSDWDSDWYNVCVKCHVSRGGHAFLGSGSDMDSTIVADYHRSELGYTCLSCHDGMELHGDGKPVEQRYEYSELPTCEGCHDQIHPDLATDNLYHTEHYTDFQCQICHSQDYNSCGICHVKDGHADIGSHLDFKIALNPIPELKEGEFALVRRTLAHPDNWTGYGEDLEYQNFDAFPTFNYTTPHNILERTKRTQEPEGEDEDRDNCYRNCHIRNEGGTLINSEYYLWADSLATFEASATGPITVDGELPSKWFVERGGNN